MEIRTKEEYLTANRLLCQRVNDHELTQEAEEAVEEIFDDVVDGDLQTFLNSGKRLIYDEEKAIIKILEKKS